MTTSVRVFPKLVAIFATLLAIGSFTGDGWAIPLSIINAGFENPVLTDGATTKPAAGVLALPGDGWQRSSDRVGTGIYNPTTAAYAAQAPEGQNVLFNNGGSTQYIYQTLSDVLTGGTYTLQAMVGNRRSEPFPKGSVELWTGGGTKLASAMVADVGSPQFLIPDNTWIDVAVTYTALAGHPLLGQPLQIRLYSTNNQIDFDNVRLDGPTATPEPATWFLLVTGLAGLGFLRKHQRRVIQLRP